MAVVTVMAFHAGVGWAPGGLLGVDVFFVLSGFLITSLLLAEWTRSGRIDLRQFWFRRARRLLPALAVLLVGTSIYVQAAAAGEPVVQFRGDVLATLLYSSNWHFISTGHDFFVHFGAARPLLHTWSLGVEEQFYLVWPILAWLALRRSGPRGLAWTAGVAAITSSALTAILYAVGVSVDRLYYGTDTRAQSLMVGALLAVVTPQVWAGAASRPPFSRRSARVALTVTGYAASAVLIYLIATVHRTQAFLYVGGFTLVALATGGIIATTVHFPSSPLSRLLSLRGLQYVGRISYGLYLYHWPVFLALTGTNTGQRGVMLLVLRFAATFLLAVCSYRFVEQPIRRGIALWRPVRPVLRQST